jgi:hypothetical protein
MPVDHLPESGGAMPGVCPIRDVGNMFPIQGEETRVIA